MLYKANQLDLIDFGKIIVLTVYFYQELVYNYSFYEIPFSFEVNIFNIFKF